MSNETAREALRARAKPYALVESKVDLGGVKVYVRALPFRQQVALRQEQEEDDQTTQARVLLHCLFDSEGNLLLDPLSDDDLALLREQPDADFWVGVGEALKESADRGKASAQTTAS